jgi:hypothetical protein
MIPVALGYLRVALESQSLAGVEYVLLQTQLFPLPETPWPILALAMLELATGPFLPFDVLPPQVLAAARR